MLVPPDNISLFGIKFFFFFRLVDNLPCATKIVIPESNEVQYEQGYKLGYTLSDKVFINNHLKIILHYHTVNK